MKRDGHSVPALARVCFLLLLVTQIYAYPRRITEPSDSSTARGSESIDILVKPIPHRFARSAQESERNGASGPQRMRDRDEVASLIETAYENQELIEPNDWTGNRRHSSSRGLQRDASRYQNTHTTSIPLKSHRAENQQGQRRLFGGQEGPSTTEMMQSDGKIVFPTDDEMLNGRHKFNPRPAPVCQGATFCERAAYYPEDLVNQAMQLNGSLKFLAGVDVVSDIVQRIDVTDDVPLCVSTEQVVYPKSAENKRKEWLFVVNQDNFKQGIRIETCSNENGDCSVIDGLAEGYRTTCKQKYIYRQLAAVSGDGKIAPDMFRFPSSCCCHVKFTGNTLARLGVSLEEQRSQTPVTKSRRRK